jgi:hypothetical protein
MQNILLIEPDYKNKYPPIGLMKLATFHKDILHDYVRFTKGRLPDALCNTKWDRVYVTSLFTFEWIETIKAINYAKTLVDTQNKVIVGGIAATLMAEQVFRETGIYPISGLLNTPNKIGISGDECIDQLIPNYSILDDISDHYEYPFYDAYFLSATKGCGMRCGFCAVQTLEPKYIPYMDIKSKIISIDNLFGQKRDLLLMDNNVLRSSQFNRIIDDILEAGFEKGAYYINPKTGKKVFRSVDFNQGLDANFLTPEKAKRLGEISLRPARIAFDHIEDYEVYERAIRLCARNGISELSNYLLFNSENFGGKGQEYQADSPEDLYSRMRITLDLKEEINSALPNDEKVSIFSFPMRYIPLSSRERGYVGSKWNPKFLRAFQCMLIPTQGKGVGNRSFFEADFGKTSNDFIRYLCMPERLISARGHFSIGGRGRINETAEQIIKRKKTWEENQVRLTEWNRLFSLLMNDKDDFIEIISENKFLPEKIFNFHTNVQKMLYLHYLTMPRMFVLLGLLKNDSPSRDIITNYLLSEFPLMYQELVSFLISAEKQQQYMFTNFFDCFQIEGLRSIIRELDKIDFDADKQMGEWSKICKTRGITTIDFELIRIYRRYIDLGALPEKKRRLAHLSILNIEMEKLNSILLENFDSFFEKCKKGIEGEKGELTLFHLSETICSEIKYKLEKYGK